MQRHTTPMYCAPEFWKPIKISLLVPNRMHGDRSKQLAPLQKDHHLVFLFHEIP
ncbi:hypothetical protein KIN20_028925 [Parelaphostrongylus tenuis]|uniref:Uncharacterized protein n=1 Tax=Parelaphostrongylus tenuis TaxID=148309 RepID=A0AAD5QTA5_PARTN|nr:hypothetical protein KIN20_020342 [Parelaphostrongylus tenuis]KAJ1367903.1 hypothetical protein KIN20_028925 [Parelaphostrongylus tenuis]